MRMKNIWILLFLFVTLVAKGQNDYELREVDGKLAYTGFTSVGGVSEEDLFVGLLLWTIDRCPKFKEGLMDVDYDKKTFSVQTQLESSKRADNPAVYYFLADYTVSEDKLSFTYSKINCECAGMLNMKTVIAFDRMKPDKKPKHRAYMEEFKKRASESVEELMEFVKTNRHMPITHWDEIRRERVVKGMNESECLLSYGKPLDIINSETGGTRWRYGNFNYLFFKSGVLTSIVD